ncbi:DUF2202 domain-containing protein [Thermococcus sp. Bubb.Bath]|uniref:DUF2202 domain-containing protein n=1 Tax=Thermococcus sp. Bubb.Bath TaxID=1638242 RepID=UPI00143ADF4F|nr:DUF2202 domain-containing protein [Thermococcus sp. Bubb.Bath]NJF24163.1 DUF2202 domain-containing protein [Thermococcus sp. Bubb.Bath]
MRKKILGIGFLVLALFGLVLGGVAAYRGAPGPNPEAEQLYQSSYADYYAPLSDEEASDLLYMVEEEKLARDVYLTLYNETGLTVFERIAQSEQSHMDAVLSLIEKYNLTAPSTLDQVGVFENSELQALYDQLIGQGSQSTVDALKVGALIEEIDIKDLGGWIANTDNEDIKQVYSNLMAGSENHLRAFVRNLESQGVEYTAQVLPQEQVDKILAGGTGHSGHGKMMAGENHSHMKGKDGDRMAKEQGGKMDGRMKGNGHEKGTHEHGKSGSGAGNRLMRGHGSGDCPMQGEGA